MTDIKNVINFVYELLQLRVSFSPFSFTLWQYFLALFMAALAVWFFKHILS